MTLTLTLLLMQSEVNRLEWTKKRLAELLPGAEACLEGGAATPVPLLTRVTALKSCTGEAMLTTRRPSRSTPQPARGEASAPGTDEMAATSPAAATEPVDSRTSQGIVSITMALPMPETPLAISSRRTGDQRMVLDRREAAELGEDVRTHLRGCPSPPGAAPRESSTAAGSATRFRTFRR